MAVALVTGASAGIGLATAVALGRAGQDVYATMRKPAAAPELSAIAAAEKLPIKILPMDVDDDASVSKTVAEVLADAGRIDVLVNNAGIQGSGPVEELLLADFRRVMETNFFGSIRCIQAVLPGMRKQGDGHIVNVSTIGGRITGMPQGPYCASKFALEAVSEILAGEVKGFGIRVAIIEPGVTTTEIFDKRRAVPKNSLYRQERRMNATFDALRKQQIPASVVATRSSRSCRPEPGSFDIRRVLTRSRFSNTAPRYPMKNGWTSTRSKATGNSRRSLSAPSDSMWNCDEAP
jgi:NAD(P)-dependent dehydrogenase (short-subunit alcohol dehydrogenase family)